MPIKGSPRRRALVPAGGGAPGCEVGNGGPARAQARHCPGSGALWPLCQRCSLRRSSAVATLRPDPPDWTVSRWSQRWGPPPPPEAPTGRACSGARLRGPGAQDGHTGLSGAAGRRPVGAAAPAQGWRPVLPVQELALCREGTAALVLGTVTCVCWVGRGGRRDRRPWRPFCGLPSSVLGPGPSL